MKILLFVFICFFVVSCVLSDDGTLRDKDGNILSVTKKEKIKRQHTLLNDQIPNNLPVSAKGGLLFDGVVVSVKKNHNGFYTTIFDVTQVLFGDIAGQKRLIIKSPMPNKTGIDFKKGEKYRVFTVYLEGAYRTWDWLGTVKIP